MSRPPVVLTIGGTDPLAGAGVVADALHVAAHGGWPLAVATAEVVQDSRGVRGFRVHPARDVADRLARALEDGRPDAIKIGMLGSVDVADAVSDALSATSVPVVLDPVLAGGTARGAALASDQLPAALRNLAASSDALLTPNTRELAALTRTDAATTAIELEAQAQALAAEGGAWLLKGGHVEPVGGDWLVDEGRVVALAAHAWAHADVHGTGCALSTAIACRLATGSSRTEAVRAARAWLAARVGTHTARVGEGRRQFVATSP